MTCWLTVSLTREDKVVAATQAPLVVRSSAPPATPTNDLSAFGSRDRLGDGACAALAWTNQKYPDAMCAAASPLAYERHACAYMLGDMLGASRLALGGDDYYYSARAVETAFQGATAARRAAIRRAFGAGSVAARYYARVAATSGDFAWTAHPDGAAPRPRSRPGSTTKALGSPPPAYCVAGTGLATGRACGAPGDRRIAGSSRSMRASRRASAATRRAHGSSSSPQPTTTPWTACARSATTSANSARSLSAARAHSLRASATGYRGR